MNTIIYFLFSSIEWLALVLLIFAMFKFPLRGYWGQIILTSAVMSMLSHFVFQVIELRTLATILQPPVIFLFLWQMFRVHIFYAGLMTIFGYLGYLLVQFSIMVTMLWMGVSMDNLVPNSMPTYLLQSTSIFIVLIVVWLLYKFRIGFTFVPDYEYTPLKLTGLNLRLLLLTIAGYICLAITNFATFSTSISSLFILLVCVVLGVLLYNAQRKEHSDD